MKITIIGAGAYALGLSFMFRENKENVTIYSKVEEEIEILKKCGKNDKYLKDIQIDKEIHLTTDLEEALNMADVIVIGVAVKFIESMCKEIKEYYKAQHILIASKGIDQNSLLFVSSIVKSIIKTSKIAVISGPTFAKDLAEKTECGLSLASKNKETIKVIKKTLENNYLRLRETTDICGVEICGSIKNVLALASGMLEGMQASSSTKASFLTDALHDVRYLIKALGGNKNTILSYAGFGDILLTCTSEESRNFRFGKMIGEKKAKKEIDTYLETNTVEGVYTLKSLSDLLKKESIKMPIIHLIYNIIFNEKNPDELVKYIINKK